MLAALWGLQVLQGDGHLWLLCLQVLGESFSLPSMKRPLASLKGLKPSQHMEMLLRQLRLDSFPQAVCRKTLLFTTPLFASSPATLRCRLVLSRSAHDKFCQRGEKRGERGGGLRWLCSHPRACRTAALSPAGKALTAATCSQLHKNNWRQNRYRSDEPYQLL